MSKFGRLQLVPFKEGWAGEAKFDEWLISKNGLDLLGETLDFSKLKVVDQQASVGSFRADIVLREGEGDKIILVENQLDWTNHDHLGKILTYAVGLGAQCVIWIAEEFYPEHLAVFDWLNRSAHGKISFYAVAIKLYKVGESDPAPLFNIVSSPMETKAAHRKFWQTFRIFLMEGNSSLKLWKPFPYAGNGWFQAGKPDCYFCGLWGEENKSIRAGFMIESKEIDEQKLFKHLKNNHRQEITNNLGKVKCEHRKARKLRYVDIWQVRENTDLMDEERWPEYHAWLMETLHKFDETFSPILRKIDLKDFMRSN